MLLGGKLVGLEVGTTLNQVYGIYKLTCWVMPGIWYIYIPSSKTL